MIGLKKLGALNKSLPVQMLVTTSQCMKDLQEGSCGWFVARWG